MARNFVHRALKVYWIEIINIAFQDTELDVQNRSHSVYVTVKNNVR